MSTPAYVENYRVTSHTKAMEDAVEIGLRSAFNEVGFTSFARVLFGLKLRGEHSYTFAAFGGLPICVNRSWETGLDILFHRPAA